MSTLKVRCGSCYGQNPSCVNCAGSGQVSVQACARCRGRGTEGGAKCLDCRGAGWRPLDQPGAVSS
jgi:DnaJ-class molecular chaperone